VITARIRLLGLLCFCLLGTAAAADLSSARPEAVGMSSERLQRLTATMRKLTDEGQLSGVVTMLAKDGKIVHYEASGWRDVESREPLKKDSIFRIYSMTKPVTGVAMMMLLEEGQWQLNDPVSKHIPELANLKVAKVNPDNGAVTQVPSDHPMTMRELMSHSGGFTYGLFGSTAVDKMYTEAKVLSFEEPLQAMIDKLGKTPLLFQPGDRWHYSVSADVQGYLVEKLSGQSLPEFFAQRIFKPLKMTDTAFSVPKEKLDRFVKFYSYDKDKQRKPAESQDYSKQPVFFSGGGGLVSTANDYARFCQMLLNEGELDGVRLLSPLTVRLMNTNMLPATAPTISPGTGFGLDFAVVEDPIASGGYWGKGSYYWGGYAGTWFWVDPVHKLTFIGMIQQVGAGTPDMRSLSRSLVYQAIVKP
jgi:CubicO group peptidase (beta-lactamase class C family)